jgi:exopolysaccharide production protein ExoQ
MKSHKAPYIIRNMEAVLTIILFVMIAGYFSIVEEQRVNQVFKTVSRIGMAVAILYVLSVLKKLGHVSALQFKHTLAPAFYVMYLILGFASFMWSSKWQHSALQWFMTAESFVFAFLFIKAVVIYNIHYKENSINMIRVFAWAIFPIIATFVIGSLLDEETFYRGMRGGKELRLGGYIMNPNELGMLSSISGALSYIYLQSTKHKFWGFLMMLAAILVLVWTSSRSSAIGFLLIMGILVLISDNKKVKIIMFSGIAVAIPLLLRYVVFKDNGGFEEVLSMTGRIPFWTALLNEGIVKEPILGFGFMRINYTDYFQGLNTYPAKMTHNTFIQILMNLGFVGFFIGFWNVALTLRNFITHKKHRYAKFFIALFIPVIINSFTEFGIFGDANFGILFWQFLTLLFIIKPAKRLRIDEQLKLRKFKQKYKIDYTIYPNPV